MLSEYQMTLPAIELEASEGRAKDVLTKGKAQAGVVPNMYSHMANSPGLLETYLEGYSAFRNESGFTSAEQELIFLVISRENGCEYCVSAHSTIADMKSGLAPQATNAIRDNTEIEDEKLSALAAFTRVMFHTRGLPSKSDVDAFQGVGYGERQILEVVLAIAIKTLSNYSNHLFHTPLDKIFEGRAWQQE